MKSKKEFIALIQSLNTDTSVCIMDMEGIVARKNVDDNAVIDLKDLTSFMINLRLFSYVDEHRMNMNTPVNSILMRFNYPWIKVKHLMLQTSGLPDMTIDESLSYDALKTEIYHSKPVYETESHYEYSIMNNYLLRYIMEDMDECDWIESIQHHIPYCQSAQTHNNYSIQMPLGHYIELISSFMINPCDYVSAELLDLMVCRNMNQATYGFSKHYGNDTLWLHDDGLSLLINTEYQEALLIVSNSNDNDTIRKLNELFLK